MARSLDHFGIDHDGRHEQVMTTGRLDRSVALAFAAAISSLIIATLVVSQSAAALDPVGTVSGSTLEAGTVALVDDDQGRSLVSLTDMGPGQPSEECIKVSYEGTILPVDVTLAATTTGPLADFVKVEIDWGEGAAFGSCDGFARGGGVYSGTLAELAATGAIDVARFRNTDDQVSFRFRFELLDDERAVGQATTLDFVWEALPG